MDDFKTTLVIIIACTLIGIGGGILIANITNRNWHSQDVALAIEQCQEDGLENCHVEYIKSGLVVVDYEVIGEQK